MDARLMGKCRRQKVMGGPQGVRYGMVWLDIERCSGCWHPNHAQNVLYVKEAGAKLSALGIKWGIYSNLNEWKAVVGNAAIAPHVPLWYAHWDGVPAFKDPTYWCVRRTMLSMCRCSPSNR